MWILLILNSLSAVFNFLRNVLSHFHFYILFFLFSSRLLPALFIMLMNRGLHYGYFIPVKLLYLTNLINSFKILPLINRCSSDFISGIPPKNIVILFSLDKEVGRRSYSPDSHPKKKFISIFFDPYVDLWL